MHLTLDDNICPDAVFLRDRRWLRLLFGREFAMQDLLVLWDAIFADGISFDLVDYIFVAMMMFLRETRKSMSWGWLEFQLIVSVDKYYFVQFNCNHTGIN